MELSRAPRSTIYAFAGIILAGAVATGSTVAADGETHGERLAKTPRGPCAKPPTVPATANRLLRLEEGSRVAIPWAAAPPVLPKGAQFALLEGNLTKAEAFTFRLKFPNGYRVMPHFHGPVEHVTVLQGTFNIGHGDTFSKTATHPLSAGSIAIMPSGMHHFVWMKCQTIVQVHGIGPWSLNYVNPADDPRNGP